MKVMGVDPGLVRAGYGLIKSENLEVLDFGIWKIKKAELPQEIKNIYKKAKEIIKIYHPDVLAIEEPFLSKNPRLALDIGKIVGALILSGLEGNCKVETYPILKIKEAVTGYGRASKEQIREMVKKILNIDKLPSYFDVSDALGVAICSVFHYQWREKIDRIS